MNIGDEKIAADRQIRVEYAGRVSEPIPQEWIRSYVDELLKLAKAFDDHSAMHAHALLRAEHAMDLVKAFRDFSAKR